MNSLEFINKDLQDFEKALENYKKRKTINNEEVDEEYIKQMTKEIENYKQIKQDLEVLEIIKEMIFERVGYYKIKRNSPKYRTITIRDKDDRFIKIELSEEQLLKLKQWLEVNENED